jgi:hypothetical protein
MLFSKLPEARVASRGARRSHAPLHAAAFAIAILLAGAAFAQPFPLTSCAADRGVSNLNCTANDIEIGGLSVNNGVTSCIAGTPVTLDLTVSLDINAQSRHDIGIFLALDGKPLVLPAAAGGSATCAVYDVPKSPMPWADLDGNACGDFDRNGLPQGTIVSRGLGLVTVTCTPDETGSLLLPTLISWDTNGSATSCQSPPAAWLRPGGPAKCRADTALRLPVQVQGRIVITKQTIPDASPGTFAFSASGPGAAPTSFTLSDNQTTVVTTGPLSGLAKAYTISEQALAGFDPTAQIVCVDRDGDARPEFVSINPATRTMTVQMSANGTVGLPELSCTFTNTRQGSITVVKNTVGGNGTFQFTGTQNFSLTTTGGTAQTVLSGLAAGTYTVSETLPREWDLLNLACVDPSGGTTTSGTTATIALAAGENVTCTWTDAARGQIQVSKTAVGGDGTFPFTGPQNFQITTSGGPGGPYTLVNLAAGTYTITEVVPTGWDLTGIVCTDPSGGTTTSGSTATIALAAGETVACTFTDRRRASIVVEKATVGGDGTFPFTGSQAFSITTTSGSGQDGTTFASVVPGNTYNIAESVPAGWSLQGASCRLAGTTTPIGSPITNGVSVTPAAGQNVICTFTDVKLGTLNIYKHSQPHAAQAFGFAAIGLAPSAFSLTDDGVNPNVITFANLAPGANGTYVITEAATAGWVLTALTCSDLADPDPSRRSTVNLAARAIDAHVSAGETLDCTFTNTEILPGSITVTKHAIGGDGTFAFANSGGVIGSPTNPATFSITTSGANHTGARALTGLAAGTYTITETVPAGWDLAPPPISCTITSGSNTVITQVANGVSVALGTTGLNVDAVACEFTDVKRGSITIAKAASPQDAQLFTFVTTSTAATTPLPSPITIADNGSTPNAQTFANLLPARYTITEQAVAGWHLADIACTGGVTVITDPSTGLVSIDLHPGEAVSCTYLNTKDGTITITKSAVGGTGSDKFLFVGALAGAIGGGESLSGAFPPGTYAITEVVPGGWNLTNIACTGATVAITGSSSSPTAGFEPGDTTVEITLAAGQSAACTYVDTRQGSIKIVKKTLGGDGTFDFGGARTFQIVTSGGTGQDSAAFASVAPGTYAVTENVPTGWRLTSLTCTNGSVTSVATATANVAVAAGEDVTCTFTDARQGTITITKRIGGDESGLFEFTVPASLDPAGKFTLQPPIDTGVSSRTFGNVSPGVYTVAELGPPAGWLFTGITCTGPSGQTSIDLANKAATISLGAGETVECIFDNIRLGNLTISVVSTGGTDTFTFAAASLGAPTFPLTTPADGVKASRVFGNLAPGTYVVQGLGAAGWALYDLFCTSDGGETYWTITASTVTIAFAHGETIECIYYYRKGTAPVLVTPIPTLDEWMLVLLAVLLAIMAGAALRRRGSTI